MKIIKRNGSEAIFDLSKIANAIEAANKEVPEDERLTARQIEYAALNVEDACKAAGHTVSVEEIQDMVEDEIMALDKFEVARKYIIYRYLQNLKRQSNTTDDKILTLIECTNEEVKQENSNKNPAVNSVQRDYMAGEVSKDLTMRMLLPREVVEAHNSGIIHFHDSDYFAQHMHNCDLVNLEEMCIRDSIRVARSHELVDEDAAVQGKRSLLDEPKVVAHAVGDEDLVEALDIAIGEGDLEMPAKWLAIVCDDLDGLDGVRELERDALRCNAALEALGCLGQCVHVEDMVEDEIMALDKFEVARKYLIYRYLQNLSLIHI